MKKHILFLSGGLKIGGVERILVEYLNNIDKEKYDVTLFLMSDFGEKAVLKQEVSKEINIRYIKSCELIKKKKENQQKKKNVLYKLKYLRFLKKEKIDSYKSFKKNLDEIPKVDVIIDFDRSFVKYTEYMKNTPKVIWIHASISELEKYKAIDIKEFGRYLSKYDKIIAICNEMAEEIKYLYPFLSDNLTILYNPFDFDRIIKKSLDKTELTSAEEEMINEDYIVAVSRIEKTQKDIPTLIRAYKLLKENGFKEKLYIVGDGEDKLEIEKMINEMGLEKHIHLLGAKKNPFVWIKNAKLFVNSSKFDGLPTVLIEAMIFEKMIVSSLC